MIVTSLEIADRYSPVHPDLKAALVALRRADLSTLSDGRHPLDGTDGFLLVSRCQGRGRDASPLEAHRRYIDVQFVVSGVELIGTRPLSQCDRPRGQFDGEKDIVFFDDLPESWLTLTAGMLAVFFPDDAHAPLAGEGPVHKVVVKLPVV